MKDPFVHSSHFQSSFAKSLKGRLKRKEPSHLVWEIIQLGQFNIMPYLDTDKVQLVPALVWRGIGLLWFSAFSHFLSLLLTK